MDLSPCKHHNHEYPLTDVSTGTTSYQELQSLFGDNSGVWRRQHQPRSGHNPAKPARLLPTNGAAPIFAPTIAINQYTTSTDSRLTTNPPTTNAHRPTNPELQSRWCAPPSPSPFPRGYFDAPGSQFCGIRDGCGLKIADEMLMDFFPPCSRRFSPPPPSRQRSSGPSPRPT